MNSNRTPKDEAFRLGIVAYLNEKPRDACPYPNCDPDLQVWWLRGWDTAQGQPKARTI